jgi:RNA polymerase-binding transcription factor DksA
MSIEIKNRYADSELAEFKIIIEEKLDTATTELRFLRDQMLEINESNSNQQSGDWTDESSSHTELEMLNNMINRQHQFIQNLQNALVRIHNKTYGICSVTGQLIDKKRLLLVPHATKSIEAKASQIEKKPLTASEKSKLMSETDDSENIMDYKDRESDITPEYFD